MYGVANFQLLSNIFLQDFEDKIIHRIKDIHQLHFWKRYIDDILVTSMEN